VVHVKRIVYIGDVILAKTSVTATEIDNKVTEYVLALATFGDATSNRNNPICVMQPKVAKASTMVSVACPCCRHYCDKLHQCKHGVNDLICVTSPKVTNARIVLAANADSFTKTAPILMSF
jgi:hypothetical protein